MNSQLRHQSHPPQDVQGFTTFITVGPESVAHRLFAVCMDAAAGVPALSARDVQFRGGLPLRARVQLGAGRRAGG